MKLNISYPATGLQKAVVIEDDKQLAQLYDKRLAQEITGDFLGEDFKGYVFRISGGNDKQGFTMKQGVLADHRVRLLLKGGPCYRPRRDGERRRKSVRGCIISHDISALALVVVKKGEKEIEGLTDGNKPRRLGPKRASKIRKLFALSKQDDVRKYVIRREIPLKEGSKRTKPKTKAPKIQRLVTPVTLKRKYHLRKVRVDRMKKSKQMASAYAKLIAKRKLEAAAKSRATKLASRLSRASADGRSSKTSKTAKTAAATDKAAKDTKTKAETPKVVEAPKTTKADKTAKPAAKAEAAKPAAKPAAKAEAPKAAAKTEAPKAAAKADKPAAKPAAKAEAPKAAAKTEAPKPAAKADKPAAKAEAPKAAGKAKKGGK